MEDPSGLARASIVPEASNHAPSPDHYVGSFEALASLVRYFRKSGNWIFRGVKRETYGLIPKIGRSDARKHLSTGKQAGYSCTDERLLIDYFKRAARPYLQIPPANELEWIAVAQHHGMATRLLDWTESLLTAAWFAVEYGTIEFSRPTASDDPQDNSTEKHRFWPTIYALKGIPSVPPDHDGSVASLPQVSRFHPPHISPRIQAQQSVFTVHAQPDRAFTPGSGHELQVIRITETPISLLHDLNLAGINRASLFPDINGLAEHASWLYKWQRLLPASG